MTDGRSYDILYDAYQAVVKLNLELNQKLEQLENNNNNARLTDPSSVPSGPVSLGEGTVPFDLTGIDSDCRLLVYNPK